MPTWGWAVIVIGALAILAICVVLVRMQQRTAHLRQRFGPEYERTVEATGGRRDAEAELQDRQERRARMDIRPLPEDLRKRYEREWAEVQTQFVDDPFVAVAAADRLIQTVMRDEGYPMEDFDRRAEDLSVDHPRVVEHYREGHRLSIANASRQGAGTEGLRQAMQHYRALFIDLIETTESEPNGHPGRATGITTR